MEGVEVQRLVDVLVLSCGLAVGRAVVAGVVQGVDLAVLTSRDKRVFFNGIQILCSTDQRRRGEGRVGKKKRKKEFRIE